MPNFKPGTRVGQQIYFLPKKISVVGKNWYLNPVISDPELNIIGGGRFFKPPGIQ